MSGPLPSPDVLRAFDDVVPGDADRIIKMAEEQSLHRKQLERKVIDSDISRSRWGQILGFVIAIVGLVVAAVVAVYGSAIAGGVIGGGTLFLLLAYSCMECAPEAESGLISAISNCRNI